MQQQLTKRTSSLESITNHEETASLIYVEDFSPDLQKKFTLSHLYPYFKNVFDDLVLRSLVPQLQNKKPSIEKVQLMEYVSLPGVLSDRLYAILSADCSDGRINSDKFYKIMSTVYCSDLIQKMGLVFSLYDFDNDGYIQREDVKIVLSYIPLRNKPMNGSSNSLGGSSTSLS
jgi:EF-hand domain